MRVLFFSTAFPQPNDPALAPHNLHRCRALAADHRVLVVTPSPWFNRLRWPSGYSDDAGTGRMNTLRPTFYYPPRVLRGTHAWFMWQSVRAGALRSVRRFRPEVVLSYWTYPDGAVAQRIAARVGVPAVAMVGGSDVLLMEQGDAGFARQVRSVLQAADAIVTVSDHLKVRICALGIPALRVHVLPAAVDTGTFFPDDRQASRRRLGLPMERSILLAVGRIEPVKGLDVLLAACGIMARSSRDFVLYLVGEGALRPRLEGLARELGLGDRVRFVGRVAQAALPDWYRAADLTVLSSLSEGTPNVLLESHACGTPFVASRVGGVPNLALDGIDLMVDPGDASALAAALADRLGRPSDLGPAQQVGGWGESAQVLSTVLARVTAQGPMTATRGAITSVGNGL